MDILQRELLDNEQICFCMIASVDEPHIYLKYKAIVKNRSIQGDNIAYWVNIVDVLEDFEDIRDYLHRSKQRVFSKQNDRGQIKRFDCFDLTINMQTFNDEFRKRYSDYSWYLPAVFVFPTYEELQKYIIYADSLLATKLETTLIKLRNRTHK